MKLRVIKRYQMSGLPVFVIEKRIFPGVWVTPRYFCNKIFYDLRDAMDAADIYVDSHKKNKKVFVHYRTE